MLAPPSTAGSQAQTRTASASFVSGSPRLAPPKSQAQLQVPGPGQYNIPPSQPRRVRRSASFSSTSSRFASASTCTPAPDSYSPIRTYATGELLRAQPASSSFASSSARELPHNKWAYEVPGASYCASEFVPRKPLRRSASFVSTSSRLMSPNSKTPPPGAYDPDGRSSTTQTYSFCRTFIP